MHDVCGIPIVISRGTPYEIGVNHGKAFPEKVHRSFEYNLKSCLKSGYVTEEELYRLANAYIKPVERYNKDYIEEVQGIADGSGMKLEDIMLLNCRTELQKIGCNKKDSLGRIQAAGSHCEDEHCTSIAVTGEKTIDGATYVGQTWDNYGWAKDALIFHIIEQKNGKPSIAYCGEAGVITRSGMNSAGIGDGVNSLTTDAPVNLEGVPLQFLLRGVLDSTNLGDAIDAVNLGRNGAVNNIMIGYKDSCAADVEMDTGCAGIIFPTDGILTHTNNYYCPGHPRYPYVDKGSGNSYYRQYRSDLILRSIKDRKITIEDVQAAFSDHMDTPACICRHPLDPNKSDEMQLITVFAFVCNLSTLEMRFAPHNPCEGFVTVKPFDLL